MPGCNPTVIWRQYNVIQRMHRDHQPLDLANREGALRISRAAMVITVHTHAVLEWRFRMICLGAIIFSHSGSSWGATYCQLGASLCRSSVCTYRATGASPKSGSLLRCINIIPHSTTSARRLVVGEPPDKISSLVQQLTYQADMELELLI